MSETFAPYMTASGGLKMQAKHAGTCDRCKQPVTLGSTIKWYRPTRHRQTGAFVPGYVVHDFCPAVQS